MRQDHDVECCVRQLGSSVEEERIDAAQALAFFVYQTDDEAEAMRVALLALANSLRDASVKVRRAVAKSLLDLIPDARTIPDGFVDLLRTALEDSDDVVRSRITRVLKEAC